MRLGALAAMAATLISFETGCKSHVSDSRSKEIEEILSHRCVNRWELDTTGLPQAAADPRDTERNGGVFILPPKPGVADAFRYEIVLSADKHQFWIVKTGGFAGESIAFGPAPVRN